MESKRPLFTLIKNGDVYSPSYVGKQDIAIAGDKIAFISPTIDCPDGLMPATIVDASDKIVVPGFIDAHVHIIGGGGEGGFKTRTPELQLTEATLAGVTTVIGVIGTDGTTRTMGALIAKARALEEEGITCYVQTGSYQVPVKTLTGKIEDDLILIDKIIGVGEIAISDHRSSQPTAEELAKIASASRIGGMLSGKGGIVNIHVGDHHTCLSLIEQVVESTDIPLTQFYPTHINRNPWLFNAGLKYALNGGFVDFTTSSIPKSLTKEGVKCSSGLKIMLDEGVDIDRITFTSDAQASLPLFNGSGELTGMEVGSISSLFREVRSSILEENIPIETAIKTITENPAAILKLHQKGQIAYGKDADVVLLNKKDLSIDTVIARGRIMVESGKAVVKGTFEK